MGRGDRRARRSEATRRRSRVARCLLPGVKEEAVRVGGGRGGTGPGGTGAGGAHGERVRWEYRVFVEPYRQYRDVPPTEGTAELRVRAG